MYEGYVRIRGSFCGEPPKRLLKGHFANDSSVNVQTHYNSAGAKNRNETYEDTPARPSAKLRPQNSGLSHNVTSNDSTLTYCNSRLNATLSLTVVRKEEHKLRWIVMTEQNIAACLVLSAIGGMMGVLATAILAYPDAQKLRGKPWSPCMQHMALLLSLVFQLGIAIATIAATWYGPVSIAVPTGASAQLLFNMVMFGVFLGLESFSKEMRVGAYVVVLAAILLPVVGPGVQENQDILLLLQTLGAIVWSSILLASLAMSTVGLIISNIRRKQDTSSTLQDFNMFVFNLVAQTSGAVVGTTVAKMFVLVQGAALGVCVALWLVSSLILVYATILQATTVSQGKFVPLSVGTKIAVNAITGIIIWEDWRVVTSWVGYVCVFLYLMLGNYLLCDVDLFGAQNATYGAAATMEKMKSVVFDPKLTKSDSNEHLDNDEENNIETKHLDADDAKAGSSLKMIKSGSTTEAADLISDREVGQSSSAAEAADLVPGAAKSSSTTEAGSSKDGAGDVDGKDDAEIVEEEEAAGSAPGATDAYESTHDDKPKTASGVWRKAYQVKKKPKTDQEPYDETEMAFDPKSASGVWRKAYEVKT